MPGKRVALMVDLATSFGRRVLEGVHSHPARQNWTLLAESWGDIGWDDLSDLDGIIVESEDPDSLRKLVSLQCPTVDLTGSLTLARCSTVTADYAQVGRVAAEHLRVRGFLKVGCLGLKRWAPSEQIGQSFLQSVAQFASELFRHKTARDWSGHQSRYRDDLSDWVAALPKPCGVLVADDVAARRLLQACRKLDLKVPHQLAVLGVGDYEMVTTVSDPTLSSVIVPAREIGFQSAECLQGLFQDREKVRHLKLSSPSVASRRSTDALAWDDPLIQAALEWLNENAAESLRVPALAEHLSVSRRLLEQRFRARLGHGPAEQLRRIRLRVAETLLRETDLGLGPIAKMSGLVTAERLCVIFRHYLKLTPGAYRNMLPQPHRRQSYFGTTG